MATLWIREYSGLGRNGSAPVPMEPGTDQTPVTFTTSTQSAAFGVGTAFVAMNGSAAFHFVVGVNPTATTGALRVPADTIVHVGVKPGQKIAVVAAA